MTLASAVALLFLLAHVPLALALGQSSLLATAHVLGVLMAAGWFILSGRSWASLAAIAAYITGGEVLWRMTGAKAPWELGKYATTGIFLVGMLATRRLKIVALPTLYFLFLVPSVILTVANAQPERLRHELSFNLSGPLALMVCANFFAGERLSPTELHRLLLCLIGPALGIATLGIFRTATAENLVFSDESSYITSGGFGPNQVSSILGLGAVAAFWLSLAPELDLRVRFLTAGLTLVLLGQSVMTFSRTGLYAACFALLLAILFLVRAPHVRLRIVTLAGLVTLLGYFVIFPRMDEFTGGALSQRFGDTGVTGRDRIALADLEIWRENFLFGVGPGRSTELHALGSHSAAAHTEPTRLIAEHGLFGSFALLFLLLMGMRSLMRAEPGLGRAVVVSLLGWCAVFLASTAMRLVAPAFVFGLACARIEGGAAGDEKEARA
jgi:hypothetical protein